MALKLRITGVDEYGTNMKVLFVGEPGSGKTLASSTFPNPVFLSAEGGLMSIARRFIPYVNVTSSDDLREVLVLLRQEDPRARAQLLHDASGGQFPYPTCDTVVVDTIDEIQKMMMKERVKLTKKENFILQDYGWLNEQMQALIRALRNLNMNVVFTCHVKEVKDEEVGNVTFKPALAGQSADYITASVDLAFLLKGRSTVVVEDGQTKRKIHRTLQAMPDTQYPWIKDRSGRLPGEIEINFEDDYQRLFQHIYGGIEADFDKARELAVANLKGLETELANVGDLELPSSGRDQARKDIAEGRGVSPGELGEMRGQTETGVSVKSEAAPAPADPLEALLPDDAKGEAEKVVSKARQKASA